MTKRKLLWLGGAFYCVMIAAVVWALVDARARVVRDYATPQEQARWDEFRHEMDSRHGERESLREEIARSSGQPVEAAPPKARSPRPPVLELLDNHFTACLVVSLAGVTMVFAIIWALLMGAMLRPGRRFEESAGNSDMAAAAK